MCSMVGVQVQHMCEMCDAPERKLSVDWLAIRCVLCHYICIYSMNMANAKPIYIQFVDWSAIVNRTAFYSQAADDD